MRWTGLSLAILIMLPAWVLSAPPEDWKFSGQWTTGQGFRIAGAKAALSGTLPQNTASHFPLRLIGGKEQAAITMDGGTAPKTTLTLGIFDDIAKGGKTAKDQPLPNAGIEILLKSGTDLSRYRYYVRPNPYPYDPEKRKALLAEWDKLPGADAHTLDLKIENVEGKAFIWIDDRFIGKAAGTALAMSLPAECWLEQISAVSLPKGREMFLPVGLAGYAMPGSLKMGGLSAPVVTTQDGVPFEDGWPIDVGRYRWLDEKTGPKDFVDTYYTRSAFDSHPEDLLLAVPSDDYDFAHVLCVVDPDPAKTPVLTLRMTRYTGNFGDSGGRGDAIADSSIRLEKVDGKWPSSVSPVGTVRLGAGGHTRAFTLLHVVLPIHCGDIADVIDETGTYVGRPTKYLDLELTKELHPVRTFNYSNHSIKPLGKPSAVQVLGLTLARSPVKVRLRSRRPANIFDTSEKAGFDVELLNRTGSALVAMLNWKMTDFYGHTTEGGRPVDLKEAAPLRVPVDFENLPVGHYRVKFTLHAGQGEVVWDHATSLAVLAPDRRKAGNESPFGAWWFQNAHGGTRSLDEIGPLIQRIGFRHICPQQGLDDKDLARYHLSLSMYPWLVTPERFDAFAKEHPGLKWALVFHETNIAENLEYSPEFMGKEPTPLTEKQTERIKTVFAQGIAYARHIREKYPDVKLLVGNGSTPMIIQLMRSGFPKDLVDAWGDESVAQSVMPETPPQAYASEFWMMQYSKRFGYSAAAASCYEWRGRDTQPGDLTELEQAQFYSRDVLEALAWRMPTINPGQVHDVGDSYYYSRWGAGGLCHRWPEMAPKPGYVAMAVLTQELDSATFERVVPTPSPSLYILEFRRGAEWVYALWLPAGKRDVKLGFASDGEFRLVDMNGTATAPRTESKTLSISVSASPCYLTSSARIEQATPGPTTTQQPPPANLTVIHPLNNVTDWDVIKSADPEMDTQFEVPRRPGKISVRDVVDEARGKVLELSLQPQPEVPWAASRYETLRPKHPIAVPGSPGRIGVWVKGNSSWGRVFFELEDARGARLLSVGAPCDGFCVLDWKGKTFIDFDGWNFVSLPLPFRYASPTTSPETPGFYGPPQCDWQIDHGDGAIKYPLKVTKLVVELRDRVLHVTEPIDVPDRSIRLSDLSAVK